MVALYCVAYKRQTRAPQLAGVGEVYIADEITMHISIALEVIKLQSSVNILIFE